MKLSQGEGAAVLTARPPETADEEARLGVLQRYALNELEEDSELSAITDFAARLCGAPIALVSLVEQERQRFLARHGLDERETPRRVSFCAHAMLRDDALIVPDTLLDPTFADNDLVTGEPRIRFYAGFPLKSEEGLPLGSLCVIDREPRPQGLTDMQRHGLQVLAQSVMRRLQARRQNLAATQEREQSVIRNRYFADAIPALAFTATPDGSFDYINRRWREYAGWVDETLPEAGFPNIHPEERDDVIALWRTALTNSEQFDAEFRYRRHDGTYRWMLARALPVKTGVGDVIRWFGTLTDVHDSHVESEGRELLAKELSHRIKNIFAVVSSLVAIRSRGKPEVREFADDLTQTIGALGRAHDYVRPLEGRKGDSLHGLLGDLLAPYRHGSDTRIVVTGEDGAIGARAATPLALVMHELATNSAKYGALSQEGGAVFIDISPAEDDKCLRIVWQEDCPDFEPSEGPEGFGSRLVKLAVEGQLDGKIERTFEERGLRAEVVVSLAALAG